ncbi:NSFL1 cofactor p47 [Sporobolomyces salmoneus]|uniref:NSFL1 cofactor p47 n=1 Tax=Sporobolomyces salmoneus TaxID=183962 RepID=UPI003177AA57
MSEQEESLNQIVSVTGCSLDQAKFFLESANGDVSMAVATYFENAGQETGGASMAGGEGGEQQAEVSSSSSIGGRQQAPEVAQPQPQRGTYTLSGEPAEPLPAGWGGSGSGSNSSSRPASANRNPLRSNAGPRVTGFRDLAASSSGGGGGGGPRIGGFGGGADSDSDDENDSKDPANFYTGGAKSGLSVENPDDQRKKLGAHGEAIKRILQQAKEGSERRGPGGFGGGGAAERSSSRVFTGNAHTLGSDETPSSFIPDPSKQDEEEESEEELEIATRSLIFWQDGFSVEDSDLLKYEENQELLQAIQSGSAPLALMKVSQDQRVDLQVQKRLGEKWTRQPGPPAGPWSGSGNRLGSVSPYPDSQPTTSSASMPGAFNSSASSSETRPTPAPVSTNVQFKVDSNQPTTRLQIRLRDGEKVVATFNHSHTVGDIRRYINASRPGESSASYALQTTFPSKDLEDDSVTLKDAGLLGSVIVQRAL